MPGHDFLRRRAISARSSEERSCSSTRRTSRGSAEPMETGLTQAATLCPMTRRVGGGGGGGGGGGEGGGGGGGEILGGTKPKLGKGVWVEEDRGEGARACETSGGGRGRHGSGA